MRTQAPFGPSLWTEAHGDTGSVGVTSPWSTAGQEEVLPQYNKKLNAHSSSQGWAFTPSPSPSRRLKHICESAVSLHRNSTSHNRQRMNSTRYNKWSFPTPILLALPVQGHLEWNYSSLFAKSSGFDPFLSTVMSRRPGKHAAIKQKWIWILSWVHTQILFSASERSTKHSEEITSPWILVLHVHDMVPSI